MILASACLCGIRCRYDGASKPVMELRRLLALGRCHPFCPEQLGLLTTPRKPAEIVGGNGHDVLEGRARVLLRDRTGDVTEAFLLGARRSLQIAQLLSPEIVILKEKSPSCALELGPASPGVAAAALLRAGFAVRAGDNG